MTQRPISFAFTFLALFALVFAFMAMTDTLPDTQASHGASQNSGQNSLVEAQPTRGLFEQNSSDAQTPTRVVAKNIGLDVTVVNPATTSVDVLDEALKQGAVRYPTSALLNVDGTVMLFGHSSYLPIVYNLYYKTFDGIQNLKIGETVSVYSGTTEYRYSVTNVRVANAEQDVIQLPATGKHLVLVTCDSFATKSTRYVVSADFVGAYSTGQ
jgi:LPXTG-site transpeptidase (sortase) family protein